MEKLSEPSRKDLMSFMNSESTRIFMTMCDFSHLRSDVRKLANTRGKKKTARLWHPFKEEEDEKFSAWKRVS